MMKAEATPILRFETEVEVTLRIGNGQKLHPGTAVKTILNEGKPWEKIEFGKCQLLCSCPNARNGWGWNKARIVCEGHDRVNCGL